MAVLVDKYIKNTKLVTDEWVDKIIPAGVVEKIPTEKYEVWSLDSKTIADVASGDLLMSLDGITFLAPAQGSFWLQILVEGEAVVIRDAAAGGPFNPAYGLTTDTLDNFLNQIVEDVGPHVEEDDIQQVFSTTTFNYEGNVTVTDEGSGKATIDIGNVPTHMIGTLSKVVFVKSGNSTNLWLNTESDGISSNEAPFLVPWDCKLVRATMTNNNKGVDSNIELHKADAGDGANNVLINTWNIVDKRVDCTELDLDCAAGDKLAIYADDTGRNLRDAVITVYFVITGRTFCVGEDYNGDFSR